MNKRRSSPSPPPERSLSASPPAAAAPEAATLPAASGSAPMPTVKMMVGGIDKQIYLPYQLAQSLGYYKKYGVNVELSTEQNGGVGAEDAMASGQVDMAGAWYIHTVDFQSKGKDVIDLVQLSGAPGERDHVRHQAAACTRAADFKGKTLGVTDLGSGTDELTQFLAAKARHHEEATTTPLAVGAGATAIAAIQRGSADCVMTTQPTVGALESQEARLPGRRPRHHRRCARRRSAAPGRRPACSANADWVKSHKDAAQKVVDALVATMHWINTHSRGRHRQQAAAGLRAEQHHHARPSTSPA